MSGWAVELRLPPGDEGAAAWLVEATGHAVEERADGVIAGYLEAPADAGMLAARVRDRFGPAATVVITAAAAVDWSARWRDGLGPRRIGRLVVTPSWATASIAPGSTTLVLDPEMAFGTGEHGSTRAALALLDRYMAPGARVLDLGSGSGILAIAAGLLGARRAVGIEIDAEAIPVAERNATANAVDGVVEFVEGDATHLLPLLAPADLILSNILRQPNEALLEPIAKALDPLGVAICSGMETTEAPLFRQALAGRGWRALEECVDEGWWAVAAVPG